MNVVYCADIYHCAIVIEVIWKRILLLGSENLTKMIQYIIVADKDADSIFVVILVELTNTVFVNSTNITTNIETAVLSTWVVRAVQEVQVVQVIQVLSMWSRWSGWSWCSSLSMYIVYMV